MATEVLAKSRRSGQGMFKSLYGFHAWTGLVLAIVFLAMGITGSLTVFHDEVDWLLTPSLRVQPAETSVSLDDQVRAVAARYPDAVVRSIEAGHGRRWASIVETSEGELQRQVFVNPYTGSVQGDRIGTGPTEAIKRFHTNLWMNYLGGKWGLIGRATAGLLGLIYVLLSLTGFYIYRARFRGAFRIRTRQGARAFFADFHKVLGIWTIAFNLTMGTTAFIFGVKDGSQLFSPGREGTRGPRTESRGNKSRNAPEPFAGGLDAAASLIAEKVPSVTTSRIAVPQSAGDPVKVSATAPGAMRLPRRLSADVTTSGSVEKLMDSRNGPGNGLINGALKPLHFGRLLDGYGPAAAYGWKVLWVTLGLSPGLLSLTGALMYFSRRRYKL